MKAVERVVYLALMFFVVVWVLGLLLSGIASI